MSIADLLSLKCIPVWKCVFYYLCSWDMWALRVTCKKLKRMVDNAVERDPSIKDKVIVNTLSVTGETAGVGAGKIWGGGNPNKTTRTTCLTPLPLDILLQAISSTSPFSARASNGKKAWTTGTCPSTLRSLSTLS